MRPRKVILLIDANPDRQGVTRFVFDVHRYRVLSVSDSEETIRFGNVQIDCIVSYSPDAPTLDWLRHCPRKLVLTDNFRSTLDGLGGTGAIHAANARMETILDAIRILTKKKRGPKPGSKRKPVVSVRPGDLRKEMAA